MKKWALLLFLIFPIVHAESYPKPKFYSGDIVLTKVPEFYNKVCDGKFQIVEYFISHYTEYTIFPFFQYKYQVSYKIEPVFELNNLLCPKHWSGSEDQLTLVK